MFNMENTNATRKPMTLRERIAAIPKKPAIGPKFQEIRNSIKREIPLTKEQVNFARAHMDEFIKLFEGSRRGRNLITALMTTIGEVDSKKFWTERFAKIKSGDEPCL